MFEQKCDVCKQPIDSNSSVHFARIQRGYFKEDGEGGIDDASSNIKAEYWICHDCYLENPEFCRFMNSIGHRMR